MCFRFLLSSYLHRHLTHIISQENFSRSPYWVPITKTVVVSFPLYKWSFVGNNKKMSKKKTLFLYYGILCASWIEKSSVFSFGLFETSEVVDCQFGSDSFPFFSWFVLREVNFNLGIGSVWFEEENFPSRRLFEKKSFLLFSFFLKENELEFEKF